MAQAGPRTLKPRSATARLQGGGSGFKEAEGGLWPAPGGACAEVHPRARPLQRCACAGPHPPPLRRFAEGGISLPPRARPLCSAQAQGAAPPPSALGRVGGSHPPTPAFGACALGATAAAAIFEALHKG